MIKILDFSPFYPPHIGGLEKYAEELHENLAKRGCKVTVFTPHFPKSAQKEEIKPSIIIFRYPAFEIIPNFPVPKIWKKEFWRQWRTIRQNSYDVVFSTSRFFIQPIMALIYAKIKKTPRLHIEHGSDFVKGTFFIAFVARIFDYTLGKISISLADKIIAPSKSAARFVKLLAKKESSVIYRGMPFEKIDTILPQNNLREKFKDKTIIAYVGRLIYGKGVVHLLKAVQNLNRSNIITLIVGDGPEMKSLREYSQKNNLTEKVIFLGSVPFEEAISILKISDIFVNPSYNEGLPTSVLEAGVCERAIIATNVGGTPEIISHDQSGIIIQPYSVEEIQRAIEYLIDDPAKRNFLGKNARKKIEEKFNWEASAKVYLKEIKLLIEK